ncbi:MAG: hypothetical protein E7111_04760 [Bacteroidales bacterium]|nr:hypothetical protein [Bacteroidales bacterium]
MVRRYLEFLVVSVVLLLGGIDCFAQSKILVTGKLRNKDDEPVKGAFVFAFATEEEGNYEFRLASSEDMKEMIYQPIMPHVYGITSESDGTYEITVPSNGSLIFYNPHCTPVLVHVRGKRVHNPKMDANIQLDAATATAESGSTKTKKGRTVVVGNKYSVRDFPYILNKDRLGEIESVGRTNARLVTQMFLVNKSGTDTLWYHKPRVMDGEQYHATQALRNNDPLYELAEGHSFDKSRDTLIFNHVFELVNPKEDYYCKAHIWIEDYIKVFYCDTVELLNTGRVSRPFQFLEYSFEYGQLDHNRFKKEARKTPVDGSKDMKLKFRVNSSQLDMSDSETMASLDSLKAELRQICNDPASDLIDINFYGFSSPEGKYDKNLSLSGQRTSTVKNSVLSALPREFQKLGRRSKGEVASWSQVADILEADSLVMQALEVRKIVADNPKNIDAQGAKIRGLSYYRSEIVPRLEQLRVVRCEYKTVVTRKLEPEEIMARYKADPNFEGDYEFTLNDYWHLFAMVKDKDELEKLYRKAIKVAWAEEREHWMLPANNLAVMLLEKKQVDTTLLAPFISRKFGLNATPMDRNGKKLLVNHPSVVMNQVQMYMLAKEYEKAEELSSLLETQNPVLRAIVRCLGGYIDPEDPSDARRIDEICRSSARNTAIINMYNEVYDSTTAVILNKLPKDEPVTLYLKAQRICLEHANQATYLKTRPFDRETDPDFEHPEDKWSDFATPEQMNKQAKFIRKLEAKVREYERLQVDYANPVLVPFEETMNYFRYELDQAREKLAKMKTGEDRVFNKYEGDIKAWDAARAYLVKCFALDKKYIEIAKRDADINEDLYNDIMGIEKEGKR